ncbi:MAG: amino acid adenylation domain-containing protein, partial [Verrucomicrobia bacterium]
TALETRPAGPEDLAYVIFTSGSTGRPKGAAIPHRAAGNLMRWTRESFGFHAGDVFLQKTPFTFDASVPEIFAPLHCGARLVIAEPEGHRDPDYLGRVIQEHRVTILKVVPSQLRLLLAHPHFAARASSLRMIFPGGEALSGTLRDECRRQLPRAEIINLYGPTEAAVNTLFWRCRPGEADSVVPIGRPVTNNRAFVVDPHGNLVPFGVAGELLISGLSVGSGYINQPELTRERFLPDPFPGGEGLTAYRTGDLVRRRRDGVIEFLGRIDHQVKIRGYRIELGEIEAIAREHPGVREAVVLAREAPDGDLRLVAWLETASDDFDEDAFRGHLERRLPEYMVPAAIVAMERLPQLPNGKVDRKALPEPEPAAPAPAAQSSEPPATVVEKRLAKIWCDVLGIGSVSRDDHFFHLGGHSLTAMRVAARASETFGTPVHMTWLFAHPSLRALAEKIDQSLAAAPASAPSAASQDTLSHQEARLWFLHQTLERPESYNVPWIAVASAPLDPAALENAFRTLADRHEALRTAFITDQHGEPRRRIADALTIPVHVETTTSDGTPFRDREAIEARAREILAMPFAIDTAPLLRVHLLRSADGTDTLVVVAHHIIVDQWSMQVLIGELGTILREGAAARPPPPSITLSAYAARQRAHDHSGSLAFWIDQLRDAPGTVQLPIDRARPAIATGRGAHHRFRLSRETASGLEALARESHATRFTVGLALYAAFLSRIGGDDDIVIGTPLADRTQPELQRLVGFMLNTLPIRLRPAANLPFRQWLDRARAIILESLAHGDAPLDKIVKAIPAARAGHTAPFSVMFVHQDEPENELELNGTACERLLVSSGTAKADLTLFLAPTAEGALAANLEFSLDLFAPEAGERLARWLSTFAAHAAAHPDTPLDRLPLEPGDRLADELAAFNQTATDYPREKTVAELFREQAAATPQRPALIHGETTLTYAELESRANRLARHLSARGVRRGDFVILQIERSTAFVEAVLATLKCGAAYVPVATDLPVERLAVIVEDTGSRHLVRDGRIQTPPPADIDCFHLVEDAAAIAAHSDDFETVPAAATDAAYVMFTSGSTGRPKGVVIPHRGIIRLVRDQPALPISEETATLLLAPLAFDASTFEIWAPLLNGGRCVIYPHPHPEPDLLAATIQNHAVNTLWLTAGLFNHLVDHALEALRGVRHLLTGGDALSIPHVRRALEVLEEVQLYNGYGPTESTTFATIEPIRRDDPFLTGTVPIGRPIANTTCHVLDAHQQPVPPGIAGELYIGGDGLALGYLNDETLTRQRFVPDPFSPTPAARLYRTGDRCRWLPDGRLEFLGRLDNQVKIRGFRIEPGEIEAALLRHPAVARCAVVVSRSSVGEKRLVAWIVPEDGADPTPQALRAFLASSLPDYMIPSAFLIEDELPLNANGKIDRRALAARPVEIRETRHTATTPSPRHETEARLLRIWRQLLDTSEIGVDDDFFQLGGHSLLAMRMIHEVHREFGHTLRIADLLRAPTISGLAALLGADTASPAEERVSTFSGHGPGTPLFNIPGVMGYGLIPEALAEAIHGQRPYHDGLQIPGADKQSAPLDSLPEIASHLVKQIRAVQPHGPYCLTGFCFGGLPAYETAHQLVAAGEAVQALVLWHAFPFHLWKYRTLRRRLAEIPRGIRQGKLPYYIRRFGESVRFHLGVRLRILHPQPEALDWARDNPSIVEANRRAQRSYRAPETTIPTLVIRGNDRHGRYDIPPKGGWEYLCKGPFEIVDLPIDHITMLDEPWISQVTKLTARWLRQTDPQR